MICSCCQQCREIAIRYDWSGNASRDLDTGTTFLGSKAGYSCEQNTQYLEWQGDNTGDQSFEEVIVRFAAAREAGLWATSVQVDLAAGWYAPAGGVGDISVKVVCRTAAGVEISGSLQSITASPGSQSACASTSVGSVTILEDGSFTINPLP